MLAFPKCDWKCERESKGGCHNRPLSLDTDREFDVDSLMNIYAYVSIIEAVLKLGVVFVLPLIYRDKLTLYGILILGVTVIITAVYQIVCTKKYKECKFKFYWNKDLFKELTGYTGWNMFGASVGIFKYQMVNIVLNQFFNPVVIAARSIAASVNNAVINFSQNFNTAMRSQIIKSYAAGEKEAMLSLIFLGSKGTYLLMYLFVLPLMLETPIILELWLRKPPEYAALFTRLVLLDVLIDSINYPIMTAAHATGKIKMSEILSRYCPRVEFDSYEDFYANYRCNVPDNFNFAYDVVDKIDGLTVQPVVLIYRDRYGRRIPKYPA